MRRFLLIILLTLPVLVHAQANSISFTFSIPAGPDLRTSAAVLDSTGTMVRTLWGNVTLPPGTYTRTWDGTFDQGGAATAGVTYTIKLMLNAVTYTYDGFIGQTDSQWYKPNPETRYQAHGFAKIAWVGGQGWVVPQYSERIYNVGLVSKSSPNSLYPANVNYNNFTIQMKDVATDGAWVYLMNASFGNTYPYYTTALDAISGQPVQFTNGTSMVGLTCVFPQGCAPAGNGLWNNTTLSVIDNGTATATNIPSGIAVQRSSNVLAIAHGGQNQILLFDKRSGASLGAAITGITSPAQMAFNSEGLWVVDTTGHLYEVTGVGSTNTVTAVTTLGGITFSNVQGVAANGATNSLFVLDGGTNQQFYEFAVTTHSLMRTYGVLGGYNDCNPTISYTRLDLDGTAETGATTGNGSWIAVDDSDDVWVGDLGTAARTLHISPTNTYVNQMLAFHYNYSAVVSDTLPTRLFMHQWEFAINYNVPNVAGDPDPAVGGNGSWTLVKNWGVCDQGAHGSSPGQFVGAGGGFYKVEQLSNGRVYGVVASRGPAYTHLMELPASGTQPLRDTGINLRTPTSVTMARDCSLSYFTRTGTSPNYTVSAFKATVTGFDGSNNPIYSAYSTVATATSNSLNSLMSQSAGAFSTQLGQEATSSGFYPIFWPNQNNTSSTTHYPHLAGLKNGYASYAWTTLGEVFFSGGTSASPDYLGNFPANAGFGGHNGVGPVQTEGKNIFVAYDGQNSGNWNDQYYHVWEDGMIVGQFGNTQGYLYFSPGSGYYQSARPENAENIGDISTTQVNGDIYLYHPDEGPASIHRWHISNLASIHEWGGTGVLGVGTSVTLTQLF